MESETTLARGIAITEDMARYDASCKRLLSEKIILAWIMKACMKEFRDYSVQEIANNYIIGSPQVSEIPMAPDETNAPQIHGTGMEDTTVTEGTVTYDIHFLALIPGSEECVHLIVNIEAQNDFFPGYPLIKRALYYCCRMISSQYGTEFSHSHYEKIKKVYSIWICMNPSEQWADSITQYSVAENNIYGEAKEKEENYDLITAVMICMGKQGVESGNPLIRLLNILFSTELGKNEKKNLLEGEFQIPMTQQLEREVSEMCNLSKGVEEKGIQKGIQRGIQEGIQKGIQKGASRVNTLNMLLIDAGRFEDMKRATKDISYQTQLMLELLPEELQ